MSSLSAGYHAETIAPAQNYDLSGYVARQNPGVGIHDPVHVSGLYLEADEAVLIVSVSVLGFTPEDADSLRQSLSEECNIPSSHIMLATTHTHSAPATMRLNGCGVPNPEWWSSLRPIIHRVAAQAKAAAEPARVGVGSTLVTGIARNRRDPDGPLDERLTLVKVEFDSARPTVVIANYACHPVVLPAQNRLVSGDYPGALTRYLNAHGVETMFLTGACGDINPLTHGDFQLVENIGERLGRAALNLLPTINTTQAPIRSSTEQVKLHWEPPTPDQLVKDPGAWAGILHHTSADGSDVRRIVQTWDAWIDRHRTQAPPWPTELDTTVQVLKVGPLHIVALPGEVFCETGLFLKQQLGQDTVISGYTNGNVGYLPTAQAYPKGGYEVSEAHVYYGYPGVVMNGTAEELAQVVLDLAQQLT